MSARRTKEPSQRQLRVAEEIRHAIISCLERDQLHDPALSGRSITVTEVVVSPDLRAATVYVVPFGDALGADNSRTAQDNAERDAIVTGLQRAGPFMRRWVAERLRLRFSPRLAFALDDRFDSVAAIDRLLGMPVVAQDLEKPAGECRNNDDDVCSQHHKG